VVKVFKSVGAVRVYNPWNAIWAALGIALLLAGIGFAIGWIANNDNGGSSTSSAPAVSDAAGRQQAYQNGLAIGRRQGAAAAAKNAKPAASAVAPKTGASFKSGNSYTLNGIKSSGAYFVQVGPGGKGLRVGPHVQAVAGQTYWLCGNRVCYSPSGSH
jgi:predicted lipid-binding transport protein (Tim44 family)